MNKKKQIANTGNKQINCTVCISPTLVLVSHVDQQGTVEAIHMFRPQAPGVLQQHLGSLKRVSVG